METPGTLKKQWGGRQWYQKKEKQNKKSMGTKKHQLFLDALQKPKDNVPQKTNRGAL